MKADTHRDLCCVGLLQEPPKRGMCRSILSSQSRHEATVSFVMRVSRHGRALLSRTTPPPLYSYVASEVIQCQSILWFHVVFHFILNKQANRRLSSAPFVSALNVTAASEHHQHHLLEQWEDVELCVRPIEKG